MKQKDILGGSGYIPVGPKETLTRLVNHVDQAVCLRMPDSFFYVKPILY